MDERTCEATIYRNGLDRFCRQSSGLTSWYTEAGGLHTACRFHVKARQHRYPPCDPPEPEWLPESGDPMTMARWEADRMGNRQSWSLAGDGVW